jgi:hypothetical protein
MEQALARQSTVLDIVDEYDEKREAIEAEVKAFEDAFTRLEMAACIQGKFVAPVSRHRPHVSAADLKANLRKSGWRAVYDRLQIDRIASAKDRKQFDRAMEDPPELTFDNAKATFGDYLERPRHHILRGLAETFADLDPAYKSHSKVKIGVKGLPKRVILSNVAGYGSYGRDKLRDIVNALAAYRLQPLAEHADFAEIDGLHSYIQSRSGTANIRGLEVRKFQNGNAHVIFPPETLLDINRALAEFYGEVLPDAEDEDAKPRAGTAVSKDLQFYWSPPAVIDEALERAGIHKPSYYSKPPQPYRVLEPSCGDGRIMDEVSARGHHVFGIEYHAGRAAEARAKGHNVLTANFLECPPRAEFDRVVMNPPFYGRHYVKHVRHALEFLKPGGTLVAILPATAHYDHDELKGTWRDLPVGSFAEAGTNVPTGIMSFGRAAA